MEKKLSVPFVLVGLLVTGALGSGCASSDIDALRSQLADVQALAEQAQQQAAAATSAASAAGNAAEAAQSAADEAKTMSRDASSMAAEVKAVQDAKLNKKKK